MMLAPQLGAKSKGKHLERIKKSPAYVGNKFRNISSINRRINFRDGMSVLVTFAKMLKQGDTRSPKSRLPSTQLTFDQSTGNFLTWFGHSTFLYEVAGKKILFDPMLGSYASPFPSFVKRYDYILPSDAVSLPYLDAVVISHDHYDHLHYGTVLAIKDKVGVFITPLGTGAHLRRWGIPDERIVELDWHESTTIGEVADCVTITSVPSQHFSGRSLNDRQSSLWSAFIIHDTQAKVFFGGDSGYFDGFKTIGEDHGPFDLTLLDSGQYDERWSGVHMFPEQSVRAHTELKGKVFMPIHWSAFTLSLHSWKKPVEETLIAVEKEGVDMITPMIGQRFDVLADRPKETWWRDVN